MTEKIMGMTNHDRQMASLGTWQVRTGVARGLAAISYLLKVPAGAVASLAALLIAACAVTEVPLESGGPSLGFIPHENSVDVNWQDELSSLSDSLTNEKVEQIHITWQPTYTAEDRTELRRRHAAVDLDEDNISYNDDNCPSASNPAQQDTDGDGYGDLCDLAPNNAVIMIPQDGSVHITWRNPNRAKRIEAFSIFWLHSDGNTHSYFPAIAPTGSQELDITFTNGTMVNDKLVELVNVGEYRWTIDALYSDGSSDTIYHALTDPAVSLGPNADNDQVRDNDDEDDDNDGIPDIRESAAEYVELSAVADEIMLDSRGNWTIAGLVNNSEYQVIVSAVIIADFNASVIDTTDSDESRLVVLGTDTILLGPNADNDELANSEDPDDDNDGLTDIVEAARSPQCILNADCDGDGLLDGEDLAKSGGNYSCVLNADCDGDNVIDSFDAFVLDASESEDTDGDGIGNNRDPDIDGDGVLNGNETDRDNDGVDDVNEDFTNDAGIACSLLVDCDGDGLTDEEEYNRSVAPNSPYQNRGCINDADCDDDGIVDSQDTGIFNDIPCDLNDDCDGDTIKDGDEVAKQCIVQVDCDGDTIEDQDEITQCILAADCDNDGLLDTREVVGCITKADCDDDGLLDFNELLRCVKDADCDGDEIKDGDEVALQCVVRADCDNDRVLDRDEVARRCVVHADCDSDDIPDSAEADPRCVITPDCDGDGIADKDEPQPACITNPDCDGDSIEDGDELASDCITNVDCDGDGFTDPRDPCPLIDGLLCSSDDTPDLNLIGLAGDKSVLLRWQNPYRSSTISIRYGEKGEEDLLPIIPPPAPDSSSYVVSGLGADTDYEFELEIRDAFSSNRTSDRILVTTKPPFDSDGDGKPDDDDKCPFSRTPHFVSISDPDNAAVNDVDTDGCEDATEDDNSPPVEGLTVTQGTNATDGLVYLSWQLPTKEFLRDQPYTDILTNIRVTYTTDNGQTSFSKDIDATATSYEFSEPLAGEYVFTIELHYKTDAIVITEITQAITETTQTIQPNNDFDNDGVLNDADACQNSQNSDFISISDPTQTGFNDVDGDGCEDGVEDPSYPLPQNVMIEDSTPSERGADGTIRITWDPPRVNGVPIDPTAIYNMGVEYNNINNPLPQPPRVSIPSSERSAGSTVLSLPAGSYDFSLLIRYTTDFRKENRVDGLSGIIESDNDGDGVLDPDDDCDNSPVGFISNSDLNDPNINDVNDNGCEDTTEETLPSVSGVTASRDGYVSVRVQWVLPANREILKENGGIEIIYTRSGETSSTTLRQERDVENTNLVLNPGEYTFRIVAVYLSGARSASDAVIGRILPPDTDGDGIADSMDQCINSQTNTFISNSDLNNPNVNDIDADGCEDGVEGPDLPAVTAAMADGGLDNVSLKWQLPSNQTYSRAIDYIQINYQGDDGVKHSSEQLAKDTTTKVLSLPAGNYNLTVLLHYVSGAESESEKLTAKVVTDSDKDGIINELDSCDHSREGFISNSDLNNPNVNDVNSDGCEDGTEGSLPIARMVTAQPGFNNITVNWQLPRDIDLAAISNISIEYRLTGGSLRQTPQFKPVNSFVLTFAEGEDGEYRLQVVLHYKSGATGTTPVTTVVLRPGDRDGDHVPDADDMCLISRNPSFVSISDLNNPDVNDIDANGCEDGVEGDALPPIIGPTTFPDDNQRRIRINWQLPSDQTYSRGIETIQLNYTNRDDTSVMGSIDLPSGTTTGTLTSSQLTSLGTYDFTITLIYFSGYQAVSTVFSTRLDDDVDDDDDTILDTVDKCRFSTNSAFVSSPTNDVDRDGCEDALEDVDDDGDGLIEIATAAQLDAMRYQLDGQGLKLSETVSLDSSGCGPLGEVDLCSGYELANDISLASYASGNGWQPIGEASLDSEGYYCEGKPFNSLLEGNGFTLSDLAISRPTESCTGLFAMLSGRVQNLTIAADRIEGRRHVGTLAGALINGDISEITVTSRQIEGSSSIGSVIGIGRHAQLRNIKTSANQVLANNKTLGGLAGWLDHSQLVFSSTIVNNITNQRFYTGGLVGWSRNTTIKNSLAQVDSIRSQGHTSGGLVGRAKEVHIEGSSAAIGEVAVSSIIAGGLIGYGTFSSIAHSYAAVDTITGMSRVGGLVGDGWGSIVINASYAVFRHLVGGGAIGELMGRTTFAQVDVSASYWDVTTGGYTTAAYGIGRETRELREPLAYEGIYADWQDNACGWNFGSSIQYPVLACLSLSPDDQRRGWPDSLRDEDGDGLLNYADTGMFGTNECRTTADCDNDGTDDLADAFPLDPSESLDTDGDGTGDEADPDDDNDGKPDDEDGPNGIYSKDPSNGRDQDNDGVGDLADIDDDGDGLIEIATAAELYAIRYAPSGSGLRTHPYRPLEQEGCGGKAGITECFGYELMADISLANYRSTNQGKGWQPIGGCFGDDGIEVTAIFDGNHRTISDLTINRPDQDCVGLFGHLKDGELRNLHLRIDTISGRHTVGGLIGEVPDSPSRTAIINVSVASQSISGKSNVVGSLVGYGSSLNIINAFAHSVNISGGSFLGGLVGRGQSIIITDVSIDSITISGWGALGSLVGLGESIAITDVSINSVNITGTVQSGGLVGRGDSTTITNASIESVNINGQGQLGGLVAVSSIISITDASIKSIDMNGHSELGGLVGRGDSIIITDTSVETVAINSHFLSGGLVSAGESITITNASIESVNIKDSDYSGGLVGFVSSSVTTTSTITDVSINSVNISGGYYLGGLTGFIASRDTTGKPITIRDAFIGSVAINGDNYLGGIVGYSVKPTNMVDTSIGVVTINGSSSLGGFFGRGSFINMTDVSIIDSVAINGNSYLGGMVGESHQTNMMNTSIKSVNIGGGNYLGGLVGSGNSLNIIDSSLYSVMINGIGGEFGGMIGRASNTNIDHSFANEVSINGSYSIGGFIGLATRVDIRRSALHATHVVVDGSRPSVGTTSPNAIIGGGGFIGRSFESSIYHSYAIVNRLSPHIASGVGGLIGTIEDGNDIDFISGSYAVIGNLDTDGTPAAGLVGHLTLGPPGRFEIDGSYAVFASDSTQLGGIIGGGSRGSYQINNSYWDSDVSGIDNVSNNKGTPQDTLSLRSPTTYSEIYNHWDDSYCDTDRNGVIDNGENMDDNRLWDFGTNDDYPVLRCTPISPAEQRRLWSVDSQGKLRITQ